MKNSKFYFFAPLIKRSVETWLETMENKIQNWIKKNNLIKVGEKIQNSWEFLAVYIMHYSFNLLEMLPCCFFAK